MRTHHFIVAVSIPVLAIVGAWGRARPESPPHARASVAPDACALLTESEVSAALEVKSLAGIHAVASSTKLCGWSDVQGLDINHRRVTLSIIPIASFNFAKSNTNPKMTSEPVSGIGDEAFYEIFKTSDSPMLLVRKGSSAFNLRILNGLKLKAFTLAEVKAKEAALAKAAAARL